MKRNKIIAALFIASITLGGCNGDLLDTVPYDSVATGSMWTTENLCDKGVLGIYAQLRNYTVGLAGASSIDRYSVSTDQRDGTDGLLDGSATTGNGLFSDYWKHHYEGISRANDALENLPKATVLSDAKRARLMAEAKVLRAFFYYKLNIMYKGVPIYEKNVSGDEYRTQKRNTEAEVWTLIMRDLGDAIGETNLPDRYEKGSADFGRITKSAALAIRGKAYMWQKKWAEAEADFVKVGTMGHTLYTGSGANSYGMLFKEANEQSPEMIFSVQNIAMEGYGADWGRSLGNRTSVVNGGWNTYMVNTDFANTYENADGTPFSWSEAIPTWDKTDPQKNAVYFLRNGLTDAEKETFAKRGADMSQYLPEGNEARIKAIYAKRDPRMLQTLITPYSSIIGTITSKDIVYTLRWPYRGFDDREPFDVRTDTNARFHYLWRKFVPNGLSEYKDRLYIGIDYPLIRYADVLLSLAEAMNEQGKPITEIVPIVNQVRDRAGMAPLNGENSATKVTNQANLRERIRNERRWEFACEGVNFFDEMRWQTWHTSTKFANGNGGHKQIWGEFQYHYTWDPDNRLYIWPIPRTETEINANLTQNPGWEKFN